MISPRFAPCSLVAITNGLAAGWSSEPHGGALADLLACPPHPRLAWLNHEGDWYADKTSNAASRPALHLATRGSAKIIRPSTKMLGDHNIENIIGVGALTAGAEAPPHRTSSPNASKRHRSHAYAATGSSARPTKGSGSTQGFGSSYEKARSAIEARVRIPPTGG